MAKPRVKVPKKVKAGDTSVGLLSQAMSQLLDGNQEFAWGLMALLKTHDQDVDSPAAGDPARYCDFCGKGQREVKMLDGSTLETTGTVPD